MKTELSDVEPRGLWRWWPLRLLVLFVVLFGAYIGCQLLPLLLLKLFPALAKNEARLIGAGINVVVVVVLYRAFVRWTEQRVANELQFRSAMAPLLGGALLGFLAFVLVYGCLLALGVAKFNGFGTTDGLAWAFVVALTAGFGEEIAFRGVVFRLFEEGFGTTIAIIISGALFGLLHAANHGATIVSTASIALEAGVLLAAAYVLTRSLWLPIGVHFGWNFTEGGIFGQAVSGGTNKGLLDVSLKGPDIFTGGAFGPEASVAAVAISLALSFVLLVISARRGHWQPMRLRFRANPG